MNELKSSASLGTLFDDPALVLLDQTRLAELLGCSARTLERQRLEGTRDPKIAAGTMLTTALEYAARGWPVLPLWGKRPAIAKRHGGRGVHDATTDEATIRIVPRSRRRHRH